MPRHDRLCLLLLSLRKKRDTYKGMAVYSCSNVSENLLCEHAATKKCYFDKISSSMFLKSGITAKVLWYKRNKLFIVSLDIKRIINYFRRFLLKHNNYKQQVLRYIHRHDMALVWVLAIYLSSMTWLLDYDRAWVWV